MAYKLLTIDPQTPPRVKALIQSVENHFFRDVHTMLRLPMPEHELPAGCNFAITQVLAAAVSGISVTLYSDKGGAGARFKGLLRDFYPWSLEPGNAVKPDAGAEVIYHLIRNPLTHDLGFDLENRRKTQKIIIKRLTTDNLRKGLSEKLVEQIETDVRKVTPSPTVTISSDETVILVEVFYWGVRTMVEAISRDHPRMQAAQTFLASI
jgi:hypothetical protein